MAADWIKLRVGLRRHPKVVRMVSALKADRLRVVGALHAVWSVFDEHSTDGRLPGYSFEMMDEEIGWPGFSQAMSGIGWLDRDDDCGLKMREFSTHNGASAKRRALDADRKKSSRQSVQQMSANDADEMRTREEKRRNTKQGGPDGPAPSGPVWGEGLKVLVDAGTPEPQARSILGKMISQWHERDVVDALIASVGKPQPKDYCLGILRTKPRKPKATPEANAVLVQLRERYGDAVVLRDAKTFWDPQTQRVWSITGERLAAA